MMGAAKSFRKETYSRDGIAFNFVLTERGQATLAGHPKYEHVTTGRHAPAFPYDYQDDNELEATRISGDRLDMLQSGFNHRLDGTQAEFKSNMEQMEAGVNNRIEQLQAGFNNSMEQMQATLQKILTLADRPKASSPSGSGSDYATDDDIPLGTKMRALQQQGLAPPPSQVETPALNTHLQPANAAALRDALSHALPAPLPNTPARRGSCPPPPPAQPSNDQRIMDMLPISAAKTLISKVPGGRVVKR
ncbi:hypothetical protein DFS34DRAFT_654898 [Phlyctochytrium arcticum]|nr:hypothetical protein DFS34DRAFT_654898 [Phlyctochytrium arcticum]